MAPDSIDCGLREERILGRNQPVGEHFSTILISGYIDITFQQQMNLHRLAGARLFDLAGTRDVNDLFVRLRALLATNPSEGGGNPVVVILRPFFERMIVALGTLNPNSQEELSGRFGGVVRVSTCSPVAGSGVLEDAAAGCQQFVSQLVEPLVRTNSVVDPSLEFVDSSRREFFAIGTKNVAPLERPELGKVVALKQRVNQFCPAVTGCCGKKSLCFVDARQSPGQIEIRSSQEFFVGANIGRKNLKLLQFGKTVRVDKIVFRRVAPLEARNFFEERHVRCRHFVEVTRQDRSFAPSDFLDETVIVDAGDRLVRRSEHSQSCQVTN